MTVVGPEAQEMIQGDGREREHGAVTGATVELDLLWLHRFVVAVFQDRMRAHKWLRFIVSSIATPAIAAFATSITTAIVTVSMTAPDQAKEAAREVIEISEDVDTMLERRERVREFTRPKPGVRAPVFPDGPEPTSTQSATVIDDEMLLEKASIETRLVSLQVEWQRLERERIERAREAGVDVSQEPREFPTNIILRKLEAKK